MKTNRSLAPLVGILVVTTAYAVLRYNVFKGIAWDHVPLYVLNKAVAWTATTLILAASVQALRSRKDLLSNEYLVQAIAMGGIHVLMSLALLSATRYPDLYDASQQLSLTGELALLGGVLAAACSSWARRHATAAAALPIAIGLHCAALGARNWLLPSKWPWHMVPITLICAATAIAAAIATIRWARRPSMPTPSTSEELPTK